MAIGLSEQIDELLKAPISGEVLEPITDYLEDKSVEGNINIKEQLTGKIEIRTKVMRHTKTQ